jgi:hypothetical protein
MTVDGAVLPPPARDSRHGRPSVIASASEASAKQSRIGQGHTVRLPHITCCAARLDCFGRFAASQ